MSFGPTNYRHGGTRGGADQFKWDDVKNDKYRENYLGHSVQAPVGRWQKGKDLTWYTKLNKDDRAAALREEIALAKQRDQELMDQALGIAPKKRAQPTGQLDAAEMKELLKRGASDREGLDGERIEGLGAAPVPQDFDTKPKKTLAQKYEDDLKSGRTEEDIYALRGSTSAGADGEPRSEKEERSMKKALKKQRKKEKKAKKRERKEKKRERRARDSGEDRHSDEKRGRSSERRDRGSPRRRSMSSSSGSSRSPSRSPSGSPPARSRHTSDRRSRSRSPIRERREYTSSRRRSRSRSRSRGRRRSRSRSPEDRDYRRRNSPPRSRGRSYSRNRSPAPRRR